MLGEILSLQRNFFNSKYTELDKKGVIKTIIPETLEYPPNYNEIIQRYDEKYDSFTLSQQLEYFHTMNKLDLSHINSVPITYTSIKCDITEKELINTDNSSDIIEYYKYNNMDISREVYQAHELYSINDPNNSPKLIRFNRYSKCKNCRNIIFNRIEDDGGITITNGASQSLLIANNMLKSSDNNVASSSSSSVCSSTNTTNDSRVHMLCVSDCNNSQHSKTVSSINHLGTMYQLERTSYKAKFNSNAYSSDNIDSGKNSNHKCITSVELEKIVYPCDIAEYGSMLDWIPILKKKSSYKLILLNCNPNSEFFGRLACQKINEDNDYDYILLC